MGCEQSNRPEDTAEARENGLTAEDFEENTPVRECLTEEDIFDAEDCTYLDNWVPTPEWGGPGKGVYVLTPSGEDRERYEKLTKTLREKQGRRTVRVKEMNFDMLRERLMVDFACNVQGQRIFTFKNKEERRAKISRLKKKAAAPIGRIGDLVCDLMGWSQQDIDDMVKNSETDRS